MSHMVAAIDPPLRIGVIGAGFMARVHTAAALAAGAVPVAIAASTTASAERAANELGFPLAIDPEGLIHAPDIDVVHVCTPNSTHREYAEAVIAAGKHLICEKPIATSVPDAQHLVERARSGGTVAAVPFVYRYHPMAHEARDRAQGPGFGRLRTFQGVYLQDWLSEPSDDNWRVDDALGGPSRAFADIGSHLVDLFEFIGGDPITRLVARTRTLPREGRAQVTTEDIAVVLAETAGGAVGTLTVSQVSPGRKNHLVIELAGEGTSLRFEQERPDRLWVGGRELNVEISRDANQIGPGARRLSRVPAGHPMGYQDAFNAFVADCYDTVRGQAPPGMATLQDGLRAAVLTDAVLRSAREGTWVDVAGVPAGTLLNTT